MKDILWVFRKRVEEIITDDAHLKFSFSFMWRANRPSGFGINFQKAGL